MRDHARMDKPTVPDFRLLAHPRMPDSVFVAPLQKPAGLRDDWLEPAQRRYDQAEHRIWDELYLGRSS